MGNRGGLKMADGFGSFMQGLAANMPRVKEADSDAFYANMIAQNIQDRRMKEGYAQQDKRDKSQAEKQMEMAYRASAMPYYLQMKESGKMTEKEMADEMVLYKKRFYGDYSVQEVKAEEKKKKTGAGMGFFFGKSPFGQKVGRKTASFLGDAASIVPNAIGQSFSEGGLFGGGFSLPGNIAGNAAEFMGKQWGSDSGVLGSQDDPNTFVDGLLAELQRKQKEQGK